MASTGVWFHTRYMRTGSPETPSSETLIDLQIGRTRNSSQELLSRLRRAAVARLLSRHALLRALRHPAEKRLRAAGVLPDQPPGNQDRALLHRLHRPAGVRQSSH